MVTAEQALELLREGNRRYVSELRERSIRMIENRRREVRDVQNPVAIVLGCSDSRVPLELVFDQGLGDLFVVRVAGNVATPTQIGSIEFAADQFGTRLVVVLGHSSCGAVAATLSELECPGEMSAGLRAIVGEIRPAAVRASEEALAREPAEVLAAAIRENVRAAVRRLRNDSAVLARLARDDGMRVVGAEYSLESGVVEFLEDEPVEGRSDPDRQS